MKNILRKINLFAGFLYRYGKLKTRTSTAASAQPRTPERVLVLGYSAIGDFIFLLPALRALRRGFPKAHIVFVGTDYPNTRELLPACGLVDEIWTTEYGAPSRKTLKEINAKIRNGRFDAALATHGTLIDWFSDSLLSVPVRAGHCHKIAAPRQGWSAARYGLWKLKRGIISGEFERRLAFNRPVWIAEDDEHTVSRNLRLVSALGIPTPASSAGRPELPEPEKSRKFAENFLPKTRAKTVGVHIGAPQSQYAKIWPPERWGEVCEKLSAAYDVRVILMGGPEETDNPRRFRSTMKRPLSELVGHESFLDLLAVLRRCDLFLSNDTGLSKSAMVLGVPTVTVWGPSDRPGWGIFWEPDRHLEIYHQLSCSPCVRLGFPREGAGVINFSNCGHRKCLAELTSQEVFESVQNRYSHLLRSPQF